MRWMVFFTGFAGAIAGMVFIPAFAGAIVGLAEVSRLALGWTVFFTALAGALLGLAEILSRYRDAPRKLWRITAFYLYLAINAGLALMTLAVLITIGSGLLPTAAKIADSLAQAAGSQTPAEFADQAELYLAIYRVLAAGFGGAAFFRTSLVKSKIGGVEIGIGPSFVIDIMLEVTDRSIDRARAQERTETVPILMREVPSGFAATALTDYCMDLMQNLSAAEREQLKMNIAAIMKDAEQNSPMLSMQVGLKLINYLGYRALTKAVESLGPEIDAARRALEKHRATILAALGGGAAARESETAAPEDTAPAEPGAAADDGAGAGAAEAEQPEEADAESGDPQSGDHDGAGQDGAGADENGDETRGGPSGGGTTGGP